MKTKTILQTLLMLFFAFSVSGQQGINYKAIINDANSDALVNTNVTIQFTILENGTTSVYQETHNPTTDDNGIIIINIGEGTVVSGVFNDIDWGSHPHFLKTEIDKDDGLTDMGTTEFKTVPYAFHAKTAGNAIDISNFQSGDILQYNGNIIVPAVFSFYYQDNDGDGFGNENAFVYSPVKPAGFAETDGDSDDSDIDVNPDAVEICGDGIDNNSNGKIDEGCDLDNDGYSVFEGDCDDNNNQINPGATEICEGLDNNCDGQIDEGCDFDNDGFTIYDGDCADNNYNINPGATEICDGIDNDCDFQIDEGLEFVIYYRDLDGDGYGTQYSLSSCSGPPSESFSSIGGDCDDNDASIYPGATELCDGLDNDCDGEVDNNQPTEIVDNNYGSCSNAESIGDVCGDEGCITGSDITGIGEGWYKVLLKDCNSNSGIDNLKFLARWYVNSVIDYDLYLYSSCGVLIDQSSGSNDEVFDEVSYELIDNPISDDSQYLYIEIRWASGSSCVPWHLKIWGGCVINN